MEYLLRLRLGRAAVLEWFAWRGKNAHAAGGEDGLNAKDVRGVADDKDAMEVILLRDGEDASDGFFRGATAGFCDDGAGGYAVGAQEGFADLALGETISGSAAAERDENGCKAALIEVERVFQPCAQDARGTSVILRGAEDADDVSRGSLVGAGGVGDLRIDPAEPARQRDDADEEDEGKACAEGSLEPGEAMGSKSSSHRAAALALQSHHDFVGGDDAFAKNLPGILMVGKIDDGGGQGMG